VENKRVSSTAWLIAASLVFMHEHPEFGQLVSSQTANFCRHFLLNYSGKSATFLKIARQRWFFHFALMIERLTIPGILRHYALRKKCLSQLVRAAVEDGINQVAVLGAGFDPLALELHRDFENTRIWEIDHPATQYYKTRTVDIDARRFHFAPINLQTAKIDTGLLFDFNPAERTVWIAEGVLMYLPAAIVKEQFESTGKLSARGSRFVFTFMEPRSDGHIRFQKQTALVNWWLEREGEPFFWGSNRHQLEQFIYPWRTARVFDDSDLRELASLPPHIPVAAGELLCLANLP
jgi:methyltransferase (TIGR00027 family)